MTTMSPASQDTSTSSPPIKPQRSFRQQDTASYLERCHYSEREERRAEEEACGERQTDTGTSREEDGQKEEAAGGGDSSTEPDESDGRTAGGHGEEASSQRCPARRVIRLYQYDEDGQRYGHLPEPTAHDPGPAPRPRTRSLTRLGAIMAAASAGPPDRREGEDRTHFNMDI